MILNVHARILTHTHTHTCCCSLLCIVLAATHLKYRRYCLSCSPFVWHLPFVVTHTHTRARTHFALALESNACTGLVILESKCTSPRSFIDACSGLFRAFQHLRFSAEDDESYKSIIERDERRFKRADKDKDELLTREEFMFFLHPEESADMKDLVIDVSVCARACVRAHARQMRSGKVVKMLDAQGALGSSIVWLLL